MFEFTLYTAAGFFCLSVLGFLWVHGNSLNKTKHWPLAWLAPIVLSVLAVQFFLHALHCAVNRESPVLQVKSV